jgi:hypothetical protein
VVGWQGGMQTCQGALTRDGKRHKAKSMKRCLIADTLGIHIVTAVVALGESGDGVAGLDSAQGT